MNQKKKPDWYILINVGRFSKNFENFFLIFFEIVVSKFRKIENLLITFKKNTSDYRNYAHIIVK